MDHAQDWLRSRGIEFSGENWQANTKAIEESFKNKYGHKSDELLALAGGYHI